MDSFSKKIESGGRTRAENLYLAKLAEQAERYDEMAEYMKDLVENCLPPAPDAQLTVEERNLLSVAYKNAIGARRGSWRIIASINTKEKNRGNENVLNVISDTMQVVEDDLDQICGDIIRIVDQILLHSSATDPESCVFYHKMKGDYYRYICEYTSDEKKEGAIMSAKNAYQEAKEIAFKNLPATNSVRLGLILNFSVFLFEILNCPEDAISEAKNAFDNALSEFDTVKEEAYKDCTLIMQLLRDNMTLWSGDLAQNNTNNDDDINDNNDNNDNNDKTNHLSGGPDWENHDNDEGQNNKHKNLAQNYDLPKQTGESSENMKKEFEQS